MGFDNLTDSAFIPDFSSGRIYRTGDLGRVDPDREIEYPGRIALQVTMQGHGIDVAEIESALRHVPDVTAAAVDTFDPTPGIRNWRVITVCAPALPDPNLPPFPSSCGNGSRPP